MMNIHAHCTLNSSTMDEHGGGACEVGGAKNCIQVQWVTMATMSVASTEALTNGKEG